MEQKNLTTSVLSLSTVFCDSAEQPIDIDFTLPDYYADICKILKCCAVARVFSKVISGNNITIEGCVSINVIYCGNDNCVSSYEYQYPFSKSFDSGINTEGCVLNVKTKCEYINCRAVTSKKIDIHGAVGIYVALKSRNITNVISDYDDINVELLRGIVPATIPMGLGEKYLIVEEEIELGAGQPDLRCIIRYDADINVTDNKIMAGKVVVKGEMTIRLLYAPDDAASLQTIRYQIPFSQLLEIEGISDNCECETKASIAQLEIKPRVSASGECRRLVLNAKVLVTSECYCNNDVAVVLDAYSRKYEADINKNDVCFSKIFNNLNQKLTCKKNFDFAQGSISSISDIWCETRTDSVKFSDNAMNITGIVSVFMIAQDADAIPNFYEKTINFDYVHPIDCDGEFRCSPDISVKAVNYTLTGDCNIEIRAELNIAAAIYRCSNLSLITDINLKNGKSAVQENDSAMTVYFASSGEKIWDIARRYFADVEQLKLINEIYEDILEQDKMILIPNG